MNSRLLRYSAGLVAAVLLLQSYFVRELLMTELLFALVLIGLLVVAGTAYLIGYAVLLWVERPLPSQPKPQVAWKERSIEP
jgi:hypothetical protein